MRIILDPNVDVSAVVASGVCAERLARWLTDRPFEHLVCPILIERETEPWVDPVEVPPVTRDPKDNHLLALRRSCQSDRLVSGNSDLLALAADDVIVLTPGFSAPRSAS